MLDLPTPEVKIETLPSVEELLEARLQLDHEFSLLETERKELNSYMEECDKLASIITNVREFGVTPSIEKIFGADLYKLSESMMSTNRTDVPDELNAAYESFMDNVKEKIANFKIKFRDFMTATFKNDYALQQILIQELSRVQQGNGTLDPNAKIIANKVSEIHATYAMILKIGETPYPKIKATKDSFRDNRNAVIKHCESFKVDRNRDVLLSFDKALCYWKKSNTAKRSMMTMKSAGFDSVQVLEKCTQTLVDFDLQSFYNKWYVLTDEIYDELRNFPVSQLNDAENLYWFYINYLYYMYSAFEQVITNMLLTTTAAVKTYTKA